MKEEPIGEIVIYRTKDINNAIATEDAKRIFKDIPVVRKFRIAQLLQNLQRLEILMRSKVLKMNSKDLKEQNIRRTKS